jgi:hypothetical protein
MGFSLVKSGLPQMPQNSCPFSYSTWHFTQTGIFPFPKWFLFDHHIGFGLGGEVEGGAGAALGTSDVANLLTHASLPSSSRTRNQSPFVSRIVKEVPFFRLPITLYFVPGPSRRFTKAHKTLVTRRGGAGVTFGVGDGVGG